MQLGYTMPSPPPGYTSPATPEFVEHNSVGLRTTMETSPTESVRKAAYEGLRSVGTFVVDNGFIELIRLRNALARALGYQDFYDYKVTQAEGFGKDYLFQILDTLKDGSVDLLQQARARLVHDKGSAALQPWNMDYLMAGKVEESMDPYFPFEKSLEMWGRCFCMLGINYQGATMTVDLLDRKGKYSNAFCHWVQPAWIKADGSWQPSEANFTTLANPDTVGSGKESLTTLMHEAGHAAHFANIVQASPLFAQERAPTSVAHAKNQSLFLHRLTSDAAWRGRYARNRKGEPIPWELHEAAVRATHPYEVFELRSMLAVPYFEKALYELPDDQLTSQAIHALADRIEMEVQGGMSPRPLLSVPHIITDESSCYYHGYCLAEMSVHQTREFFYTQGEIVDQPNVGAQLTNEYWRPGNSCMFLDLVATLTQKQLSGQAWIDKISEDTENLLLRERQAYDIAVSTVRDDHTNPVDLGMRVIVKDGDMLIADSEICGSFLRTCEFFERYVKGRYFDEF